MPEKKITARVFRLDPSTGEEPHHQEYRVPLEEGMSAMDVLDYIYQHLDGTLAYYDHAGCGVGVCARCNCKVDGKAGLYCQIPVSGDVTIDPISPSKVLKDLVCERKRRGR